MDWIEAKAPPGYGHLEWDQELSEASKQQGKGSDEVRL
jgi:hypothetical protein